MGRSHFIIASGKERVQKAQFRKFNDEFGKRSLGTEGPFADFRNAVEELTGRVKGRMRQYNEQPVSATITALAPQSNWTPYSWLKVPFILGDNEKHFEDNAGAIACSKTIDHEDKKVRPVTLEELTVLAVAVLRRLGVPAFYSVLHPVKNPNGDEIQQFILPSNPVFLPFVSILHPGIQKPFIFLPESGSKQKATSLLPPFQHSIDKPAVALEVLDGGAVLSLLKIKSITAEVAALMRDVAERDPDFEDEGFIRAIGIGHTLFEGENLWTMGEVDSSIQLIRELFGPKADTLESIRQIVEKSDIHKIKCHSCHSKVASEKIVCDSAKEALSWAISFSHDEDEELKLEIDPKKLIGSIAHACVGKLIAYMNLATKMIEHTHPSSECEQVKDIKESGN